MEKEKKMTLTELSSLTGISTSTLSRAFNNCPGVDYDTWKTVQEAAEKYHYTMRKQAPRATGILFPSIPAYFWNPALSALTTSLTEHKVERAIIRYPHRSTPETVCAHIDTLVKRGVRVLLMPVCHQTVIAHLQQIKEKISLFQICEYGDIPNSFVFTSDGYGDGASLAACILQKKPQGRVLLLASQTNLSKRRLEGFCSHFPREQIIGELHYPSVPTQQKASAFAGMMAAHCGEQIPDFVVCTTGILPHIAQAIIKCHWRGKTQCIGFENPPELTHYIEEGLVAASMEQDITSISQIAADAAAKYLQEACFPSKKYTFLPGKLHVFDI